MSSIRPHQALDTQGILVYKIDSLLGLKTNIHAHFTFLIVCALVGGAQRASHTTAAVRTPHVGQTSPGQPVSPASPVPPLSGTQLLPWRCQKVEALAPWWAQIVKPTDW